MNSPPFTIRPAAPCDAATLAAFNVQLAEESEGKRLDPAVVREGVELGIARPELCRYFVAEMDSQIVGQVMITFEWSDWRAGVLWWIQSVYVRPEARGRGIFRALYRHIENLARHAPGVVGLRLYVDDHNDRAIAVYERLGMRPSGHRVYELDLAPGMPGEGAS